MRANGALLRWLSLALFGLVAAHVPTYDNNLCSTPPRHHTTSQVAYTTIGPSSTAGIEVHCSSTSCPFDDNELIDYDFTMRESYSLDTFSVYVGCLGCAADDPITVPPLQFELEGPTLEPFAQVCARSTSITPMNARPDTRLRVTRRAATTP